MPESFFDFYGYALPWVEVLSGFLLLLGLYPRVQSLLLFLVCLSFLIVGGLWKIKGGRLALPSNVLMLSGMAFILTLSPSSVLSLGNLFSGSPKKNHEDAKVPV
jgi:uncharacterized membrane protein YphA (DoxX/SURF4 family)